MAESPCTSCGACCAYFNVLFYWREGERGDSLHPVPADSFEEVDDTYRAMKGTNTRQRPRCVRLEGRIGKHVACTIYENRPTPCRKFKSSYSEGKKEPRCDEARRRHGLKPLTPEDYGVAPSSEKPLLLSNPSAEFE